MATNALGVSIPSQTWTGTFRESVNCGTYYQVREVLEWSPGAGGGSALALEFTSESPRAALDHFLAFWGPDIAGRRACVEARRAEPGSRIGFMVYSAPVLTAVADRSGVFAVKEWEP